jgi:hypothetical protein
MEVLMMKSLCVRVAAVGLLAAVFGGSAQAAPQFYNWYLDFTFGPLTGQEFRGTISVDGNACPGGRCVGNFTAPPPATSHPLLSLNITVGGVSFALANDTGFGSGFPDVTFNPLGQLSAVDYQGQVISGGLPYTLDTSGANVGELVAFYQGTVGNPVGRTLSIARLGVPEPGTIPLLGAALIAVLLLARRNRSSESPAGLLS